MENNNENVRTLHYFWFGGREKGPVIEKCIASWKKFLPDWNIKEWNETDFDVNSCRYSKEAYEAKKYAFVSDYARFKILYEQGGLYLDTDVEIIKPLDDILKYDAFVGYETKSILNPGLGLWFSKPGNPVLKETLDVYEKLSFIMPDGSFNQKTICMYFSEILEPYGLGEDNGEIKTVNGITVLPKDFLNPFNDLTGVLKKTDRTVAIHWYAKSWMSAPKKLRNKLTRLLHRLSGKYD